LTLLVEASAGEKRRRDAPGAAAEPDSESDDDVGPRAPPGDGAPDPLPAKAIKRPRSKFMLHTLSHFFQCCFDSFLSLVVFFRPLTALRHEAELLGALPCAALYERSYMHREIVTHVLVSLKRF
jgi:hypothetical protein